MPTFNPAGGQLVADDLRATFRSLDAGLHDAARLVSTFVEVCSGSNLPPSRSQRALRAMSASISKAVESRGDMIDAQRVLVAIKDDSNLDVHDFGCLIFRADNDRQAPVTGDRASPVASA